MKITVDTQHDSHEDIKKVIKMLQNLVGYSQEVFTNQPESQENIASPIANIFGENASSQATPPETTQTAQEAPEESSTSTEDLFAELFSEEELKKMDTTKAKEEEEDEEEEKEVKSKSKKYGVEFY